MKKQINLSGPWEFTVDWDGSNISRIPSGLLSRDEWMQALVPGTVHTDLLNNNKIEDPFYRDNELKVRWVAEVGWVYRKSFHVPEEMLAPDAVQLVAEGLDTFSTLYLNDQEVARTQNMFIEHRLDVKNYLHPGENEIRIRFDSPVVTTQRDEEKYGKLFASHENHRVYARKAQYSFGWDWGPKLPTSGIWRPMYIETFDAIRLKDVCVETSLNDSFDMAGVSVQVEVEIVSKENVSLSAHVELNGVSKQLEIHENHFTIPFEIENPELWWPAGFGEQRLYQLQVHIYVNGKIADERSVRFGIRKVEWLQETDRWGESFLLRINHEPIFCKGANWIPADSFLPRVSDGKYKEILDSAKDANMNMLRVWGGGIYEKEIFYNLCDELGLLVWQDFMFACGAYPDHDEFRENVSQEVEAVIKRLRNHSSVVIWCGNNENEWIWKSDTGRPPEEMSGYDLFHDTIPNICKRLDPSRLYWSSSPFSGQDPNSADAGNRHQWNIWSGWEDFTAVKDDRGRFISEFGFQAPANLSTFKRVTAPEDRFPQSEMMEFHNKQDEGTDRLFRFLAAHVQIPVTFEDFIYRCQVVQGEALKHCIEHWRRNKFRTSGTLIWQLNDCWPVSSWSVIDSDLKSKAAYFYTKRAFTPILVSLSEKSGGIGVWVINDTKTPFNARLKLTGLDFDGEEYFSKTVERHIGANSAVSVCELVRQELQTDSSSSRYLKAELFVDEELVSVNRFYFKRMKHLRIPQPSFHKKLEKRIEGGWLLKLRSSHFAKSVRIESDVNIKVDDNYFDLEANCDKEVNIVLLADDEISTDAIHIHSLWDRVGQITR